MTVPVYLDLRGETPGGEALQPVAAHLRAGGIAALPTETVYGFSGRCSAEAVGRLASLKRRDASRPFLLLARDAEQVAALSWTEAAEELARIFWPGALTLVLGDPGRIFPDGVRSPEGTVAVRVSPHPVVAALLRLVDGPLTSTSANAPGGPPARSGQEALEVARTLGAGAELLVVDGGALPASGPSTIVDCSGPVPEVIRHGTVPVNRLRCALPEIHER